MRWRTFRSFTLVSLFVSLLNAAEMKIEDAQRSLLGQWAVDVADTAAINNITDKKSREYQAISHQYFKQAYTFKEKNIASINQDNRGEVKVSYDLFITRDGTFILALDLDAFSNDYTRCEMTQEKITLHPIPSFSRTRLPVVLKRVTKPQEP